MKTKGQLRSENDELITLLKRTTNITTGVMAAINGHIECMIKLADLISTTVVATFPNSETQTHEKLAEVVNNYNLAMIETD